MRLHKHALEHVASEGEDCAVVDAEQSDIDSTGGMAMSLHAHVGVFGTIRNFTLPHPITSLQPTTLHWTSRQPVPPRPSPLHPFCFCFLVSRTHALGMKFKDTGLVLGPRRQKSLG
jgi:hypothetical protein